MKKIYFWLGDLSFDFLSSPASEEHSAGHAFAKLKPASGRSLLQDRGRESDTISMSFQLHKSFIDPKAFYESLFEKCRSGEVLALVYSNGEYPGDFVIEKIKRSDLKTDGSRNWISVNVDIELFEAKSRGSIEDADSSVVNITEESPYA